MGKKVFYMASGREFMGQYREAGSPIELTEEEAKYPLLSGAILIEKPKKKRTSITTKRVDEDAADRD